MCLVLGGWWLGWDPAPCPQLAAVGRSDGRTLPSLPHVLPFGTCPNLRGLQRIEVLSSYDVRCTLPAVQSLGKVPFIFWMNVSHFLLPSVITWFIFVFHVVSALITCITIAYSAFLFFLLGVCPTAFSKHALWLYTPAIS